MGGAEVSSELLARGLRDAGHEAFVISAALDPAGARAENVDGVPVHRLPTGLPYPILSHARQPRWAKIRWHAMDLWNPTVHAAATRVLETERPQVVHTNVLAGLSPSLWTAARRLGIPVLHTMRDYYLLCVRSSLTKASGALCERRCAHCWAFSQWQRWLTGNLSAIVGISQFVLGKHREFGFFHNIPGHVIPNAVPPSGAACTPKPPGLPLVLVYMGRLASSKGPQVVLETLAREPKLPVRLHVCGAGPDAEELHARYGLDSRVVFEGNVTGDRKQAILNQADVMVVPSIWHEPFGRTVIEAYQHGLVVIASRAGGLPELIEEGSTGRLFEPGNGQQLAALLSELAAAPDKLAAMKQRAAERARDFSLTRHVENYLAVYRSLQQ